MNIEKQFCEYFIMETIWYFRNLGCQTGGLSCPAFVAAAFLIKLVHIRITRRMGISELPTKLEARNSISVCVERL